MELETINGWTLSNQYDTCRWKLNGDYYPLGYFLTLDFKEKTGVRTRLDLYNYLKDNSSQLDVCFVNYALRFLGLSSAASPPAYKHRTLGYKLKKSSIGASTVCVYSHDDQGKWTLKPLGAGTVQRWDFKPSLKFFPKDKTPKNSLFFGLELELASDLDSYELYHILTEVEPKQDPFFYFKYDSSIYSGRSNRYELVTHPCTPRYLRKNFRIFFDKLEKVLADKGLKVSDVIEHEHVDKMGLHIHLSRKAFSSKQHLSRFLCVWNSTRGTRPLFQTLSKRKEDYTKSIYTFPSTSYKGVYLSHRLRIDSVLKERVPDGVEYTSDQVQYSMNKRPVVHTCNSSTVEIRIFAGIPTLDHILECILISELTFQATDQMGYRDFDSNFPKFLLGLALKNKKYRPIYGALKKCA